jgi:molybdopterin converting factor small subunit
VKVLFFGRLKEVAGRAEDAIELAEASTIEQLFSQYVTRLPELARYRSSLVASALHSGDEVAFLPPVSGG